jgi:nitronate monooxygenase
MWIDNRLSEVLNIEHPILQAPMAGASNPALVSAVCHCGGLGGLGAAGMGPDSLRDQVRAIKELTKQPFNVNLFNRDTEVYDHSIKVTDKLSQQLQSYHSEFGLGDVPAPIALFGPAEDQLEVLLNEQVPVISLHFGMAEETVQRIHAAGSKVICSATTVAEARTLEAMGVDVIVAQGGEAGGHRGTDHNEHQNSQHNSLVGTLALVPAVVDAVSIPVVAAGGIMDARGMVAAAALGAAGVQLGTVFLGCPEAGITDAWLARLDAAEGDDTGVTEVISGKAARGIRNRYINELEALDTTLLPYPAQYSLSRDLRRAAVEKGESDFQALWAGQGVGLFRRQSVAELFEALLTESSAIARSMGA